MLQCVGTGQATARSPPHIWQAPLPAAPRSPHPPTVACTGRPRLFRPAPARPRPPARLHVPPRRVAVGNHAYKLGRAKLLVHTSSAAPWSSTLALSNSHSHHVMHFPFTVATNYSMCGPPRCPTPVSCSWQEPPGLAGPRPPRATLCRQRQE